MISINRNIVVLDACYHVGALPMAPKCFLSNPITCKANNRIMSSYYHEEGHIGYPDKEGLTTLLGGMVGSLASLDLLLTQKAEQLCSTEGINYKSLEPIQRLFLTHYRCPICKLLPLYNLNLAHPKRVRCGKCSNLISFTNAGKYGRLRKKIAFALQLPADGRIGIL